MKDFILEIPKWEGKIVFSEEVITLFLVIVALIAGVLLCFWGYRYLQTMVLILWGCLCGMFGYKIGSDMTGNEILQMCIFVILLSNAVSEFMTLSYSSFLVCVCYI